MKKIFYLIIACFLYTTDCYSQIAVSYNPFNSWLGVSSSTEKLLWAELKVETNSFITNLNSEFSPMINFRRTEVVNYYAGAGINFNVSNSFSDLNIWNGQYVVVGCRVKPFSKVRNLNFLFEISPYVNKDFNSGKLRTNLGIAYLFGKIKKTSTE